MTANDRLPVSLLTGFLGSGKTTLLNHLVKQPQFHRAVLIINEFGEIGLDHELVETAQEDMVLLNNGCLCCTVRGDLIRAIHDLFLRLARKQIAAFERIVIETTGLADPAPILQTLMTDPVITARLRLDGVIAVIDAATGLKTLERHAEAAKQAAIADRLLLSKIDLASKTAIAKLKQRLQQLNPAAPILLAHHGTVDAGHVTVLGLYDPSRKTLDVQNWLKADSYPQLHSHHAGHGHEQGNEHRHDVNRHDAHISASCFVIEQPVSGARFDLWIGALMAFLGPNLLRVKGIIHLADHDRPMVIHGVQHIFHPPVFLNHDGGSDRRSRIVFIGYDLDISLLRDTFKIIGPASVQEAGPATDALFDLAPVDAGSHDIALYEVLPPARKAP